MLKPEYLRIFLAIYEIQNFTKTAEVLGLPKATVSDSIQKLESQVGTVLFQRTTRKVVVTQEGEQFYERCRDLMADFEEVETMFQKSGPEISGKLRVDMPVPLARQVIVPKLGDFLDKYPKIKIELSCTDRKVDVVREGFDFVIRVGSLSDSSLIAKKVGDYTMVNCVSPAYIKRFGLPRTLEDLDRHYQIHYEQTLGGQPDGFEYFDGAKYVTKKTKALVTVNNTEAYRTSCLAGYGIIQGPEAGLDDDIKAGRLKKILTKFVAAPAPVNIVYANRRLMTKRQRLFMEWVEAHIRKFIF